MFSTLIVCITKIIIRLDLIKIFFFAVNLKIIFKSYKRIKNYVVAFYTFFRHRKANGILVLNVENKRFNGTRNKERQLNKKKCREMLTSNFFFSFEYNEKAIKTQHKQIKACNFI